MNTELSLESAKERKENQEVVKQQIREQENLEEEALAAEEREELEALYANSIKNFRQGDIVKGSIVKIDKDLVLVDVGLKSEGTISIYEFPQKGKNLKLGDKIDVFLECIENKEGLIVLSREKANEIKVWEKITRAYEKGDMLEGIVVGKARGGLTIDIGLKAFLPASQIDVRPIKNLERLIGEKFKVNVIKMNKKRNNIIASRRVFLEKERKEAKDCLLTNLEQGKILEGVVRTITDYGVFVDLGGIDGLLHITDMSWGRLNHPSELFAVGDKISVVVLRYEPEQERISLGYKQLKEDPWNKVKEKYPLGSKIIAKVVNITDYGIFVELETGVEALVHISEISWSKHLKHPSRIVAMGDIVEAIVLDIDQERRRISLGMKQTEANPWLNVEEKYPPGSIVEGKARTITNFGVFVELEEGVEGLVHISDLSWTKKIKHPAELFKKKEQVKAVVLKVDQENERLSLGVKQLEANPWEMILERYPLNTRFKGKVTKITDFGLFIELPEGIEGLLRKNENNLEINKLNVGEEIEVEVVKIDPQSKKINLALVASGEE